MRTPEDIPTPSMCQESRAYAETRMTTPQSNGELPDGMTLVEVIERDAGPALWYVRHPDFPGDTWRASWDEDGFLTLTEPASTTVGEHDAECVHCREGSCLRRRVVHPYVGVGYTLHGCRDEVQ